MLFRPLEGIRNFEYVDPRWAKVQAALSLGDRKLGRLLEYVAMAGDKMSDWKRGQKLTGINLADYSDKARDTEYELPWDHIDVGVPKNLLLHEYEKACEFLRSM